MKKILFHQLFRTLIGKGWLFVIALVVYITFSASYLFSQQAHLVSEFENYNQLSRAESALVNAGLAITDAYSDLFFIVEEMDRDAILERVHTHFQQLQHKYQALGEFYPDQATSFRIIIGLLADTVNQPSPEKLLLLRQGLANNKKKVDELVEANKLLRGFTVDQLIQRSRDLAMNALYLGILGIFSAGVIISIFFTRMALDLRALRSQLKNILTRQHAPIERVRRQDELGDVMRYTHQVAQQLEQRNGELTVERQKRLYHERQSAVDHLLAGLVHELGNPIAAVSTITQSAIYMEQDETKLVYWNQVSEYIERMTSVLADLNRLGLNDSETHSVIDINEELTNTVKRFKYDERWQEIQPAITLDLNLKPTSINGAALQQVLGIIVNYSINNALLNPVPAITIVSSSNRNGTEIIIENNGPLPNFELNNVLMTDINWDNLSENEIDLVATCFLANNMGATLIMAPLSDTAQLILRFGNPQISEEINQ